MARKIERFLAALEHDDPRGHYPKAPLEKTDTSKLEEGGGAAGPGVGFFLGDFFEVGDVCSGLREDVVEIVADADKRETFVEKFADARRAEKKEAEDDIVFASLFDQALGGGVEFGRSVHVGKFIFFVEAHRHAEIV